MFKQFYSILAASLTFAVLFVACENSGTVAVDGNDFDNKIIPASGGNYPADLLYSEHHEWVKISGNDAFIGMTDYASKKFNNIMVFEDGILEDDDVVIICKTKKT